jgi:thiol-disulfide isomerase/thioredoxin
MQKSLSCAAKNQNFYLTMKAIENLAKVASIIFLMAVCQMTQAEPANSPNSPSISNEADTADTAWNELQRAIIFPKKPLEWDTQPPTDEQKEKFHKQIVDEALVAADKAKAFYLRFPDSTNVIPAKILECQMLERVFNNVGATQDSVIAWGNAQDALLADARLTGKDRCDLRLAILQRKQLDHRFDYNSFMLEYEKDLRDLIRDYPQSDEAYDRLLDLAARSLDEKARSIASEILALPVSDNNKTKAEGILRRLNAVGKPLDIKFTALDGRLVDLSQMKGKVVLVDFWATWCGPCVGEIPHVKEAYEQFHAKGFEVVGISFDSIQQNLQRFVEQKQLLWPQYFDGKVWENKFGVQYGIGYIPVMWLMDKKGNLRELNGRTDLQGKVEKLLAE